MAFNGHGAPAGFETRGLLLDGTEVKSGASGMTNAYKAITFNPALWKTGLKDKDAAFLRFKASQIIYLSADGANGDADFAADEWHRVPINSLGYIKAAAAANLSYIIEVA